MAVGVKGYVCSRADVQPVAFAVNYILDLLSAAGTPSKVADATIWRKPEPVSNMAMTGPDEHFIVEQSTVLGACCSFGQSSPASELDGQPARVTSASWLSRTVGEW